MGFAIDDFAENARFNMSGQGDAYSLAGDYDRIEDIYGSEGRAVGVIFKTGSGISF